MQLLIFPQTRFSLSLLSFMPSSSYSLCAFILLQINVSMSSDIGTNEVFQNKWFCKKTSLRKVEVVVLQNWNTQKTKDYN